MKINKIKKFLTMCMVIALLAGVTVSVTSCTLFDSGEEESSDSKDKDKDKKKKKDKKKDKDKNKDKEQEATPSPEPTEEPAPQYEDETISFADMTLVIPASWGGKYYSEQDSDGIWFYQKASYDMEKGMGYIFGLMSCDEIQSTEAGYRTIAYADDKYYYAIFPTDVPCYLDDTNISDEYFLMSNEAQDIVDSVQISNPTVCFRIDDYIIPNSDTMVIPDYYCYSLDSFRLWIARNEIFARHGMKFDNEYLQKYFDKKPWYVCENKKVQESELNETEKQNIQIIKAAEEEGTTWDKSDFPKSYKFNKEYQEDLDGDGTNEKFKVTCQKDKNDKYSYNQSIIIDGTEFKLDDMEAYLDTPVTDEFYLSEIRPYFGEKQIILLDEGPSSDYVSHYFDYENGSLYYVGVLEGFTTTDYLGFNPFYSTGCVVTEERCDILTYTHYYGESWYDRDNHSFRDQTYGFREITDAVPHETKKDIRVYSNSKLTEEITIPKGTVVYFVSEDPKELIVKIRTKEGLEGYLKRDKTKCTILPGEEEPSEMFEDINFCD